MTKNNNLLNWKFISQAIIVSCVAITIGVQSASSSTTVGANISTGGTLTVTGESLLNGNNTIGNADSDTLTINSGIWTFGSTATTTISITNGLNFDSNTFFIDPHTNRVGIGTTEPESPLHVTSSYREVRIGASATSDASLYAVASHLSVSKVIHAKHFNTGGYSIYSETGKNYFEGSVGIGTVSPSAMLSVGASSQFQVNSTGDIITSATGELTIGGTGNSSFAGNVGVGTSTPQNLLNVFDTATSTIEIDSNSLTQGGCLKIKDVDGGGYTYCYVLDGAMTCSATSCE